MRYEARQPHRFSYADYLGFEGDIRWELIDGAAHAMAPAPTTRHRRIVQNLAVLLFHSFAARLVARSSPRRMSSSPTSTSCNPTAPELNVNVPDLFEDVPIERPVLLAPPGGYGSPAPS